MIHIKNFINGRMQDALNGATIPVYEPATGEVYASLPNSNQSDIDAAVEAARKAFPMWSSASPSARSKHLIRIAERIEKDIDSLALAESIDNGKPFNLAKRVDIPRAVDNFKFFATAILHEHEEAYHTSKGVLNYTHSAAVGVAACISPWNLPLYLFTWKIAPALAAGCTVVAKPSEITPMTAFLFGQICQEEGLPSGVLNIVNGLGAEAGSALVNHSGVDAISFTGGTATGKAIAQSAAPRFKKLSLELGGKNAAIVFADCDFENTLKGLMLAMFSNQGQICLCASRVLIERPIYEKLRDALVEKTKKLIPGDPLDDGTKIGAVASAAHRDKILSYIDLAKEEGGTILCGGGEGKVKGRCENGYFIMPTLVEGLPPGCRVDSEEVFGPLVSLAPFDSAEEAITLANNTAYGLSATVWTSNLAKAHQVSEALEAGVIWVNCWLLRDLRTPFGGMKGSGVGREGGFHALDFFREVKNICIQTEAGPRLEH